MRGGREAVQHNAVAVSEAHARLPMLAPRLLPTLLTAVFGDAAHLGEDGRVTSECAVRVNIKNLICSVQIV